jgi:hypothetical protein
LAAGIVAGSVVTKILHDLAWFRLRRAVVAPDPAWIDIESFGFQQQRLPMTRRRS